MSLVRDRNVKRSVARKFSDATANFEAGLARALRFRR
jgi:hypothetical protein